MDNSSLQGPHPALSTAAMTDNPLATADANAGYYTSWFYCTFTGSLMQMNLAMPTSITDGHALSQLFGEDEDRQEIDSGEGDIDAFLDQFFLFDDDDDPPPPPLCPQGKTYENRDGACRHLRCPAHRPIRAKQLRYLQHQRPRQHQRQRLDQRSFMQSSALVLVWPLALVVP